MSGWDSVPDSAASTPKKGGGWDAIPDVGPTAAPSGNWQDNLRTIRLPNGSPTVQRPDGAVYIKESNDSRFKGQEGWHFQDPETGIFTPAPAEDSSNWSPSKRNFGIESLKNFGRNLKAGVEAPLEAIQGLGHNALNKVGLESDQDHAQAIRALLERERYRKALKNNSGSGAGVTQFIGEAAPTAAMMAMAPEAAAGSSFAPRAASLALPAAATTYATTPGDSATRAKAATTALVAAPVLQGAVEKAAVPAVEWAAGKVAAIKDKSLPAAAQAIQDLGDRFGVRTLAPDLTSSPAMNKTAVLMESVPGSGMVAQRTAQQAEAKAAAQKLLDQYGISGDASTQIQQGLKNRLAEGKAKTSAAYDRVGQLAQGKGDVPLDQTIQAIQQAKAAEMSAALPDEGLIGLLGKMESRLTDPKAAVDKSYTGVRGLRSDLGNMISDYYKGTNAATGSKGVGVLQGIKNALEGDMSAFTSANGPELAAAAKHADSVYKSQVLPFKDQMLAKAVKSDTPDEIYGTFVKVGKVGRAQKFYAALDPDGQAAVRSQMVNDAMQAATKKDGVFSPAEFAASLEKVKDASGVFFKGQDKFELDGFTNLMRHIQRAGQIGENPPTGARMVQSMIAGEGIGGATAAVMGRPAALAPLGVSYLTARTLNTLFKSPRGKALLLSAADLQPGSKAMSDVANRVQAFITKSSTPAYSNVSPLRPDTVSTSKVAQAQEQE